MVSAAGFQRALIKELLGAPVAIVEDDEGGDGGGQLGAITIGAAVDDLLLEGAVKAFDDAVGLGLADEGETGREAMKATLALEVVGEVLAAVIVAQLDAAGRIGAAGAEDVGERLGDRLVSSETITALADVMTETLGIPVFDGGKQTQPAIVDGPHFRAIGGPAHVGRVGGDAAIMCFGRRWRRAVRRKQAILAH